MKNKMTLLIGVIVLTSMLIAACSPQVAVDDSMVKEEMASEVMEENAEEPMDVGKEDMTEEEPMGETSHEDDMDSEEDSDHADGEMMEDNDAEMESEDGEMMDEAMMDTPDWFNASLIDARTGETFTVADYKGKVVLVETLAMWCSNCLRQQQQVQALHTLIGERDDFISLGIDIDPNENTDALKSYIDSNGFDWHYTVASVEVAREIGNLYGDQFLNPPSTPMLIIDRQGNAHPLPFGIKSAESLNEALQPFLSESM
jgi:hypothetical protein